MPLSPTLLLVVAAHFFNDFYMGFLTPLFPIAMEKFSLSLSMVGAISMVSSLASALSQPVFGYLFDRYRVNSSLYLAPLATGILISCLGVASGFPLYLVLLFLGCLGSAAFHPKGATITPSLSGSHPEMGMALFSAGGNLGLAAGPVVIAVFISIAGMKAMPVLAIPAAAVALWLALALPAREMQQKTAGAARITWKSMVSDRAGLKVLARLVFINFCLTVGIRGISTFLPVHMADMGVTVTSIGVFFTVMLALGAVGSIFVSTASRRLGKKPLILGSILAGIPLTLGGLILLPSTVGYLLVILGVAILTMTNPILILFAQSYAGNSPAMASSLLMGISWGAGGLVMVPLGGLGEAIGMRLMLLIVGAFPLVGLISGLKIPRK